MNKLYFNDKRFLERPEWINCISLPKSNFEFVCRLNKANKVDFVVISLSFTSIIMVNSNGNYFNLFQYFDKLQEIILKCLPSQKLIKLINNSAKILN